jgi:Tfp pilus assembly protein PilN
VALLIYFLLGELQLRGLHNQIDDLKAQIQADKAASDQAIAKYRKFQEQETRINEVANFVQSRPVIAELINNLSATLPVNVAIDTFDLREDVITIRGTVRGSPDKASGYASAYVEVLRNAPQFGSLFAEVSLTNLSRVPATGRVAIEVVIKLAGKETK